MSETIEGTLVCGAIAARCICVKDPGHVEAGDPIHGCNPDMCTGQWTGDWNTPTFIVTSLPFPGPANNVDLGPLMFKFDDYDVSYHRARRQQWDENIRRAVLPPLEPIRFNLTDLS